MTAPIPEPDRREHIRGLGFDPDQVQAVVVTATAAVAIAADYPEPYRLPAEEV